MPLSWKLRGPSDLWPLLHGPVCLRGSFSGPTYFSFLVLFLFGQPHLWSPRAGGEASPPLALITGLHDYNCRFLLPSSPNDSRRWIWISSVTWNQLLSEIGRLIFPPEWDMPFRAAVSLQLVAYWAALFSDRRRNKVPFGRITTSWSDRETPSAPRLGTRWIEGHGRLITRICIWWVWNEFCKNN